MEEEEETVITSPDSHMIMASYLHGIIVQCIVYNSVYKGNMHCINYVNFYRYLAKVPRYLTGQWIYDASNRKERFIKQKVG